MPEQVPSPTTNDAVDSIRQGMLGHHPRVTPGSRLASQGRSSGIQAARPSFSEGRRENTDGSHPSYGRQARFLRSDSLVAVACTVLLRYNQYSVRRHIRSAAVRVEVAAGAVSDRSRGKMVKAGLGCTNDKSLEER